MPKNISFFIFLFILNLSFTQNNVKQFKNCLRIKKNANIRITEKSCGRGASPASATVKVKDAKPGSSAGIQASHLSLCVQEYRSTGFLLHGL